MLKIFLTTLFLAQGVFAQEWQVPNECIEEVPGYICITGTLYGPNNFELWTGDSGACENPEKVVIARRYACAVGTLYGPNNMKIWSGDSSGCGNPRSIKIGNWYACVNGTVYGPNNFQKWTGDSSYCEKAILN